MTRRLRGIGSQGVRALASLSLAGMLACGFAMTGCSGDNATPGDSGPDVSVPSEGGGEGGRDGATPDTGPDVKTDANPPPDTGVPETALMQLAAPTFTPPTGTTNPVPVTISEVWPAGVTGQILYTTNGSVPATGAPATLLYVSAIPVTQTENIIAIATAPGYATSSPAVAMYTVTPTDGGPDAPVAQPCATPTFMPAAGTYTSAQSVTITSTTPGATIYYTTNNTNPTSGSTVYGTPIAVSQTETIRAMCTAPGFTPSLVQPATYTVNIPPGTVVAPTPSPAAGVQNNDFLVSLTTSTPAATICFTLDGSTPACAAGVCQGTALTYNAQTQVPISGTVTNPATGGVTLNAVACKAGSTDGVMAAQTYTLQVATPQLAGPAPGPQLFDVNTATLHPLLSTTTTGVVTANYSTNPAAPPSCASGTTVPGALPTNFPAITETNGAVTYLFAACKTGYKASAVYTANYTFLLNLPTFAPPGGATYDAPQNVTIADALNVGANDWECYTTDGTMATCGAATNSCAGSGTLLGVGSVPVTVTGTSLSAIACGGITGHMFISSTAIASGPYTLQLDPLKFTPPTGTAVNANGMLSVDITQNGMGTPYDFICWTTGATTPTCACPVGMGSTLTKTLGASVPGIMVTPTTTINAVACVNSSALLPVSGTASYQGANALAMPSIGPAANQSGPVDVVFTNNDTSAAEICFTTDGSAPAPAPGCVTNAATTCTASVPGTAGANTITVPTLVTHTAETVKAVACDSTGVKTTSTAATITYTITVAAPVIAPAAGSIAIGTTATWTSATASATFAFTTDGTTPNCTTAGVATSVQLTNPAETTVKVIACDPNFSPSAVASTTYSYFIHAPVLTPNGATPFTDVTSVVITNPPSDGVAGDTLCYTLSGAVPTCTLGACGMGSTTYAGPVAVDTTGTVLKAIACNADGLANSAETDATYTLQIGALTFAPDPAVTQTVPTTITVALATPPAAPYTICTALGAVSIPPQPNTCAGLQAYLNTGLMAAPWTCVNDTTPATVAGTQATSTAVSAVACKTGLLWSTSQKTYTFNPYSHTIMVDGINDFSVANDQVATVGANLAYISWDATNLYLGYSGFTAGSGETVDAYFGNGVTGTINSDGAAGGPGLLTEPASFHLKWIDTSTTAVIDQFTGMPGSWAATAIPVTVGHTGAGSTFVEFAVPRAAIGFSSNANPLHIAGGLINALGTAYVAGAEWPVPNTDTVPWGHVYVLNFAASTPPNMSAIQ